MAEQTAPLQPDQSVGLRWTSHPLVDMGIATIVAFCERAGPDEVTLSDLEQVAAYMESALGAPSLRSHASVLFTINVPYLQPSFSIERRKEKAQELLRAFTQLNPDATVPCAYCGRNATRLETETGRAYRELVPLLTGQGVVNFAPYGHHGLPLCGLCVTALQALALGTPSCEGRALIVSADDPSQLVALVQSWLPDIRTRIQLSEATGAKVETWKAPKSRLIERLLDLQRKQRLADVPTGFTIYHASNSGQGPRIDIHFLPAPVVGFVLRAQAAAHHSAWRVLEGRAWRDAKRNAAEREPTTDERPLWRNTLYEDLFRLPDNAPAFVRRHFLAPQMALLKEPPAGGRTPLWNLTQLFLQEVLGVEEHRIQAIRELGDALADEVAGLNDRPLFRAAFQATRYPSVRRLLLGASSRRVRRGEAPILSFDDFLTVFEVGEEIPRSDWRLAWDLVLIRLIDQLHQRDWIRQHRDAAEELAVVEQQALTETEAAEEDLPVGMPA